MGLRSSATWSPGSVTVTRVGEGISKHARDGPEIQSAGLEPPGEAERPRSSTRALNQRAGDENRACALRLGIIGLSGGVFALTSANGFC